MKLKHIHIQRADSGEFFGNAAFTTQGAKLTVFLPSDLVSRILESAGPEIAREAQRIGARIAE